MGGSPTDPLPEGWDESVPETLWPDALVTCVRMDLEALGSQRVIATLVEWRKALKSKDPGVRDEARRRLRAICNVLLGEEDLTADQTVDAYDLLAERPTAAIAVKKELAKAREASKAPPKEREERPIAPPKSPEGAAGPVKVTGLRRTGEPPPPPKERPRAALAQVRTLYSAIISFCEELIPLSYERRARRFWAYWRDVSGDRGVRRELVEELLRSSTDAASLVSGLIAEVQNVDLESVKVLVAKIESAGRPSKPEPGARASAPKGVAPIEVVGSAIDLSKRGD